MSPHEKMKKLDRDGHAYVVFLNGDDDTQFDVLSHSPDWIEVVDRQGSSRFVNLRLLASIAIIEM